MFSFFSFIAQEFEQFYLSLDEMLNIKIHSCDYDYTWIKLFYRLKSRRRR